MNARWSAAFLLTLGAAVLSAQMPRPSGSPEPARPLRHLEYAFSVHREGLAGDEINGTSDEPVWLNNVGIAGSGGSGTMSIDVLSIAPDGALIVRISEFLKLDPRPRQAYTCTVYGNTTVACPSVPAPSQAEWILLGYLGREFVDAAPWDLQHQWRRTERTGRYDLVERFTLLPASDGQHAMIHEIKETSVHNGGASARHEDITISYDRAMEIPNLIHDDFTATSDDGFNTGHATFEFQLRKDSFAKS